ncbi:MAG: hypothetical protein FWC86_03780, partial [Coriobacteriia bacterium]|nr:hypothetical protein [Coriobacteriia bacterium]
MALSFLPVFEAAIPEAAAATAGTYLYTWGNNDNGQLGQGDSGAGTERLIPTRVGTEDNWIQVATAAGGALALNAEGHIYTWGAAWTAPQMGQGDNPDNPGTGLITVPTRVGDRDNWVFVAFGGATTAAINDQGHLYMWGSNSGLQSGALGQGDTAPRNIPTRVPGNQNWTSASVGQLSLAITADGYLYSWGRNDFGQLGQGTITPFESTPARVSIGNNWKLASEHGEIAAAINKSGELFAWGRNHSGQLALGDYSDRNVPTRVGTEANWVDVVTMAAVIALNSDGEIWSGGVSSLGRLGRIPDAANPANLLGQVGDADNWIALGGGNGHIIAMNANLELYAWGSNGSGQLGIGEIGGFRDAPEFVLQSYALVGFSQTGAGFHSMALMRTTPIEIESDITKQLIKPLGTPIPNLEFTFSVTKHSFNGTNTASALAQLPDIPARTITIDNTSTVTTSATSGITTLTASTDLL